MDELSPDTSDLTGEPFRVAFAMESLRLSGGHLVVIEHARQLVERHGVDVTLVVVGRPGGSNWGPDQLEGIRVTGLSDLPVEPFDLVVATWWETVSALDRIPGRRYAYFVQSLEDRFSDSDDPRGFLAGLTYSLGLPVITEARWIARSLRSMSPGTPCHLTPNGIDKDVFPLGTDRPLAGDGRLRVLVEAGTWDPALKGVADALASVDAMAEPVEVTVVGSVDGLGLPAGVTVRPPVPQRELSELYASHDVLLKLPRVEGMYGPPLEAFHRGATVVTTPVTGHDEYVAHGVNALVADWDDPAGTARLLDLLACDRDLLARLRSGALETAARWPSWEQAGQAFAAALREIASAPGPDDVGARLQIFRSAERYASEVSARVHDLKVTVAGREAHLEKLDRAWQEAEARADYFAEATQRTAEEADDARHRLTRSDAECERLRAELDQRLDQRMVRLARKLRSRMRRAG